MKYMLKGFVLSYVVYTHKDAYYVHVRYNTEKICQYMYVHGVDSDLTSCLFVFCMCVTKSYCVFRVFVA